MLGFSPANRAALSLKAQIFAFLHDRVSVEIVIVPVREVRPVVAAAAFFACQRGTRHQQSQRMQVAQFAFGPAWLFAFR